MSYKHNNKKRNRWSEKTRDERTRIKLIFLSFVGILVIFTFFLDYKKSAELEEIEESKMDQDKQQKEQVEKVDADEVKEVESKYKSDKRNTETDHHNKDSKNGDEQDDSASSEIDDEAYIPQDEFDYVGLYKEQFGEELIHQALKDTEVVMDMYLKKEKSKSKWKKFGSKAFMKDLDANLYEGKKKRKKESPFEIFATEQYEEDEVFIGCLVDFEDTVELFNIIFVEDDTKEKLVVDKIVPMWST